MREEGRAGIEYLEAVTTLLQRIRSAHPTKGLYEAAELQWWWRASRPTDNLPQLFWFDDLGRPEAAVIATDWGDRVAFDPFLMPDAAPEMVGHVIERGLAHVSKSGLGAVELEVSQDDDVLRDVLLRHGFAITAEDCFVEAWLDADARPDIAPLSEEYRLSSRLDTMDRAHHNQRTEPDMSRRLLETSLYRSDLDLLVLDRDENSAAFGVFWYDAETSTGLVEPMRTEEAHQQRGLARYILTAGIDLLAKAGADRIKIVFESDNLASSHLYQDVGFEPVKKTDVFSLN